MKSQDLNPGQGLCKEGLAPCAVFGARQEPGMLQLRSTHLGRGWLEDRIVPLAAGVPRSLVGRPVTVQGGSSQGASTAAQFTVCFQEEVCPLWAAEKEQG